MTKAVDFIVYHAFVGFWNRECMSMERLGIGFDFDVDRFGGLESEVPLKRNQCLSNRS